MNSEAELDALLDHLTEQARTTESVIAVLYSGDGELGIGLGLDESVVTCNPAGADPPYLVSVGADDAEGDIVFYYCGHYSDFPRRNAVPLEQAREAMRRYLDNPKPPENLRWEET